MADLWPFENVGCTYVTLVTLVTLVTTESSSKSKSIWPMKNTVHFKDFKSKLKIKFKPLKFRHYSYGSRLGNKLWTRLRLGKTFLNSHGFALQKIDSPSCMCHFKNETTIHYFLDCFLYTVERQSMFDQVSQLVPNFNRLSKTKKLDLLLFGIPDNDEFDTNIKIAKYVQTFILDTKRFLMRK